MVIVTAEGKSVKKGKENSFLDDYKIHLIYLRELKCIGYADFQKLVLIFTLRSEFHTR